MPSISIQPNSISQPIFASAGSQITVTPASGATATVQYTLDSEGTVKSNAATWLTWPKGTVSADVSDIVNEPAFFRVTAITGVVTINVEQTPSWLKKSVLTPDFASMAPTYATNAQGQVTGLVGVDGGVIGIDLLPFVTNLSALKPVAAALMASVNSEFVIAGQGDSLTQLGGDTANLSSDTLAEQYGYLAALRRELNIRMGLSTYDGGQYLPADATPSDTRVANGASPVLVAQFNPYCAYRDASSVQQNRKAASLQSVGQSVTYTVNARYLYIITWENNPTGYNGTYSYQIDGGGITNVTSTALTDTFRLVTIDLGTQAAHTVVLLWVSSKVLIAGAYTGNGKGISTMRFGVGGTTTVDWNVRQEKEIRSTFKTIPAALQIIRFSYNDWQKQSTGGQLTTPTVFAANLQTLITAAQANPATKAVILLCDPSTSTADNLTNSYAAYDTAAKALATGSVAFIDLKGALPTWTVQNGYGYFVDFVHHTASGYAAEAKLIADILTSTMLIKA